MIQIHLVWPQQLPWHLMASAQNRNRLNSKAVELNKIPGLETSPWTQHKEVSGHKLGRDLLTTEQYFNRFKRMPNDTFPSPDRAFSLNVSSWEWKYFPLDIIFASLISHIASAFSNPRAGCKRMCRSTISNFNSTNFTVVEMSKKETARMKEEKKRLWQTLISEKQAGKKKRRQRKKKPITHAGKPTAGKCCTRVACSESDNPPVSSLCVNLNFYLLLWGKRQLPYR